jgi:hypothetical protein
MRVSLALIAALAFAPAGHALADPRIQITPIGDGGYRVTVEGRGVVVDEAQYAVEKKAAGICGRKPFELGGYRLGQSSSLNTATSAQGVLTYIQDFRCVDRQAQAAKVVVAHDDKTVLDLTERFFGARDGGDYKAALAMFDADTRRIADGWADDAARFKQQAGESIDRKIVGITWYDNPASVSRPGVYASVDYVGRYANVPEDCGHLLWRTVDGKSFELVHEEHAFIPTGTVAKLSTAEIDVMRKKIGCAA